MGQHHILVTISRRLRSIRSADTPRPGEASRSTGKLRTPFRPADRPVPISS